MGQTEVQERRADQGVIRLPTVRPGQRLGRLPPEELARILEGLDEIVGG